MERKARQKVREGRRQTEGKGRVRRSRAPRRDTEEDRKSR